jgi:SAM-dependent methyltransferase
MGQILLDIGCGPGYASLDLAEMVGPSGHIFAVDRSRRFLDALDTARRRYGLENIDTVEMDLDEAALPEVDAHGAWCRWVFAFVRQPRDLVSRIYTALRPGATLVIHEYFDYSTWKLAPRSAEMEDFVRTVIKSWRASGGEPDVGMDLPRWLEEFRFEVRSLRPLIEVITPAEFFWQWPKTFLQVGLDRLVNLGHLDIDRARAVAAAVAKREAEPGTFMITPAVLEIIAVRR